MENFNKSIKMKNKKQLNLSITGINGNKETIINENNYYGDDKKEICQNKLSIIKDFIYIIISQDSYYLFDIIEFK